MRDIRLTVWLSVLDKSQCLTCAALARSVFALLTVSVVERSLRLTVSSQLSRRRIAFIFVVVKPFCRIRRHVVYVRQSRRIKIGFVVPLEFEGNDPKNLKLSPSIREKIRYNVLTMFIVFLNYITDFEFA